MGKYTLVTGN